MSGCPVRCKFCATAKLKKWRNLSAEEMVEQVDFIVGKNPEFNPSLSKEIKCNMTRMGEPWLNIAQVRKACEILIKKYPNIHIYLSTIGIKDADYSWIKDNVTLQVSVHSFDEHHRDWLIPYNRKMTLEELGQIRTQSKLKTTINLTLVDESDFNIEKLKQWFDPKFFFVKLSPVNKNDISEKNHLGDGVIKAVNLV
jgi:23S rRNA (adenine2503-C2)-methyltransferase